VATTIWKPIAPDAPGAGFVTPTADLLERRVRQSAVVRRFVEQLVAGQEGEAAPDLSERDWERIWTAARGAPSQEQAIARVVLRAYLLRREADVPSGSAPVPIPDQFARPDELAIPVDFGRMPVPPGPESALIDPGPTEHVLVPVPSPSSPSHSDQGGGRKSLRRQPARVHSRPKERTLGDRQRRRWLSVASWLRNLGALLILFAAWQLWGTAITQHHSQSQLQKQFTAEVHQAAPVHGFTLAPATARLVDPSPGTVMGLLQVPKIGVSEYIVSGTDANDLALGPGHYLYTALPGQAGNVAIAGHRTTHGAPFNRLAELAPGDPIYLTTTGGQRLTYVVAVPPAPVSPSDVSVLNNFGDNRLTLTTCNPEFSARQRLIVVAAYQPPGAVHAEPIVKGRGQPYRSAPASANGWDMSLAPVVLIELALVVALGLANRRLSRTYGRAGRWLILIPVWTALVFALFQTLTNFLPAAV
jgi:sortase A